MLLAIIAVSPYRRQLLPAAFEAAYGERAASAGIRSHLRPHRARRPPHQRGGRFDAHGAVYSRISPEIRRGALSAVSQRRFSAPPAPSGPPNRRPPRLQSSVHPSGRWVAVPSRIPRSATGPPVDFAAAAAAGAPSRRRPRHSDPSTTLPPAMQVPQPALAAICTWR